jgi:hypothetical protein
MVRLLLLVLFWFSPLWAQAASITAQFDRNPVALGDPVTLTFSANGIVDGEPDFSPLQQNFEIRGNSQSNSFAMINGVSSIQTAWELNLYPRKTGTLTLPPIQFGNDQCQLPALQVLDQAPPTPGGADNDILIEMEVEPKQPYVQQQTLVTQRMLHLAPLEQQATLSHPPIEVGKGDIQQVGETRNTTLMRNGRNYQVIERRYALFPQQSGELTLGRTVFDGILAEPGPNSFDPFGISGKRIRRFSQALTLQVQAQPATYPSSKQWLPAKSVSLNAHWGTPADKLKAGEPVTLTLGIVADGLTAEQLPKLDVQAPAGIKVYTDKPEFHNETNSAGVIGVRQEKWVILAPYNGDYELPAITLGWWNTTTGKQETAQIGAVKMHVSGGQAAPVGSTPPAATTANIQQQAATPALATPAPVTPISNRWTFWEWLAASLLLVIVLILAWLMWLWWKKQGISITKRAAALPPQADARAVLRQLEQACRQNQPQAAHNALLQWMDIGSLREQASPVLQAELDALNRTLFGRDGEKWTGAALWQAIQTFKPATTSTANSSGLEELYPQ